MQASLADTLIFMELWDIPTMFDLTVSILHPKPYTPPETLNTQP